MNTPLKIVYDTMSGNTRRFASKLAEQTGAITESITEYSGGFFLFITYTFDVGNVPKSSQDFLEQHGDFMVAVVSSGSYHWGIHYGQAAERISTQYSVPTLGRFNKSGTRQDVEAVAEYVLQYRMLPDELDPLDRINKNPIHKIGY